MAFIHSGNIIWFVFENFSVNIVVLRDGVVAEQGTPEELMEKDSIYRHMTEQQMLSQNWKME